MNKIKYIFTLALIFTLGLSSTGFAVPWMSGISETAPVPAAGDVIVVQLGNGTTRCGFSSQAAPVEFAASINWAYTDFKTDFRNLMNQVYSRLNVADKSAYPVFIIEPDGKNTYRRVDMADVLMGENQTPWMYIMLNSYVTLWANQPASASGLIYHAENNHSWITPIVGGWPYIEPYLNEFDYHEQDLARRADSVFWTLVYIDSNNRPDLNEYVILTGSHFQGISQADISSMEERLKLQRIFWDDVHKVFTFGDPEMTPWNSAKAMCLDGILQSWELAFTQDHFQANGADYVRQYIF